MAERVQPISKLKRRYPKEWLLLTDVTADELTHPINGNHHSVKTLPVEVLVS